MLYLTGENRVCDDSDWSFEVTTDADIARAVSLGLVIQGVSLRDGVLQKEPVKKILTQEALKLQALTGCVIDVDNGGWLRAILVYVVVCYTHASIQIIIYILLLIIVFAGCPRIRYLGISTQVLRLHLI